MPYLPPIYHTTAKSAAEATRQQDVARLQSILRRHLQQEQQQQQQQKKSSPRAGGSDGDDTANGGEGQRIRSSSARSASSARNNREGGDSTQFASSARAVRPPRSPRTHSSSTTAGKNLRSGSTVSADGQRDPSVEQQQQHASQDKASRRASASSNNNTNNNTNSTTQTAVATTDNKKGSSKANGSSRGPIDYKAVAFVDDADKVACPECGAKFSIHKHMRYRQHVFDCRRDNGKDPLMPLQVARKSHATVPRDEFATVVRPIQATLMTVDLFAGVPMVAKRSNRDVSESIKAAVRKWTKALAASSGQLFTLQKPEGGASEGKDGAQEGTNTSDKKTKKAKGASSADDHEGEDGEGHKTVSHSANDAKPPHGTSERMEMDVNDALRDAILEASVVPTDGSTKGSCNLNLSKLSIPYRQSSRIASVLHPLDGSAPMPIRVIDLTKARFVGEESAQVFFAAVMKSSSIERIITSSSSTSSSKTKEDGSGSGGAGGDENDNTGSEEEVNGLARHLAKTRFHASTILEHLAANAATRRDDDEDRSFLMCVNAYHIANEDFQTNATDITNKVRAFAASLQQEEMDARKAILRLMSDDRTEHERRLAKIAFKKAKAADRQAFVLDEAAKRRVIEDAAFNATVRVLLEFERHRRTSTVEHDESDERYRLKFTERENVFRCVQIKNARNEWYAAQRLFLEEEAEVAKGDILQVFIEEMKIYKHQQDQHKLIANWRRRQREELEAVLRTEDRLRETIKKDEDLQFMTARERLLKAIESIHIKDRSQRSFVEDYERMRRKELEGAVTVFFETNLYFFNGKSRVLKALGRVEEHERSRLRALSETPKISLEGLKTKHNMLVFATPTPGHEPSDPTTVFGDSLKASCAMSPDWLASLQSIERQCKKAVDDERAAMVDCLQLIQRHYRVRADAAAIALEPVNGEEPEMEEVVKISKPTAVPITLRQVGGRAAANDRHRMRATTNGNASGSSAKEAVVTFDQASTSTDQPFITSPTGPSPPAATMRSTSNLAAIRNAMAQRNNRSGGGGGNGNGTLSISLKGPLTAQDLYSAEEDIAAAQSEILDLRMAWYDKVSASEIRRQKERITAAKIVVHLSEADSDLEAAKAVPCEHNLLSALMARDDLLVTVACDGEVVAPIVSPAANGGGADEGGDEESEADGDDAAGDLTATATDGAFGDGGAAGNAKNRDTRKLNLNALSYAGKVLEISLEPITADNELRFMEQRMAIADAAAAASGGRRGSRRRSTATMMDTSTRSRGSVMSVGSHNGHHQEGEGGDDITPPLPPPNPTGVDMPTIIEALSTVLYRCTMGSELYGKHGSVSTHLKYSLELTVEVCDAYLESSVPLQQPPADYSPNTNAASPNTLVPHPPSAAGSPNNNGGGGSTAAAASNTAAAFVLPTLADLYEPRQPQIRARKVTLTHSGRIEVGVVPTLFTVDPTAAAASAASSPPLSAATGAASAPSQQPSVEASLAPKVIVEGQMDAIPVVRAMARLDDQWVTVLNPTDENGQPTEKQAELRRRDDPRNAAPDVQIVGGLCGGALVFEVLGEGVSNFDRLSLAEEPGVIRFDSVTAGRAKSIERIYIHDIFFGTIGEGVAQVTHSLVPSTAAPAHGPHFTVKIDSRYPANLVDDSAQRLVKQLRYHNYQEGPAEGERKVRITVETADGARSAFDSKFEVEAIDKPTELRLPFDKVLHRIPCLAVPPFMRGALTDVLVPIFPQAVVFDEDTDRFGGGFLKVTMNNAGKGDGIAFCPNSHLFNYIEEAFGIKPLISVAEDSNEVVFEGRVVATIVEGEVLRTRQWTGERQCSLIHLTFAPDDNCSIAAMQAIVRCFVYVNSNPAHNSKGHPMAPKDFAVDCQVMDNEQASKISKFVTIKGGSHTVQLLEKGASLDYKENNPPVKLGYFDLNKDSINPVNNFGGGYILVSLVEGYDNDVIQLKAEEGEYTLIEARKVRSKNALASAVSAVRFLGGAAGVGGGGGQMLASSKTAATFGSGGGSANLAASKSMAVGGSSSSAAAATAASNSAAEKLMALHTASLIKDAAADRYDAATMRPVAIAFQGMNQAMATCLPFKGGLLIQLAPDTRRDQIQRRHVMTLLRNITYFHNGLDVKCTQKVARVFVTDSMANTPTQALVQINLEVADDITEIRCKSPKRRVVQSLENNYPLLPYGRSFIHDNDTEFFDGGSLFLQCIAGSSKGDGFTILPPHLQQQHPLNGRRSMLVAGNASVNNSAVLLDESVRAGSPSASVGSGGGGGNTNNGMRLQRCMPIIPDYTVPMETSIVYNEFMRNFIDGEGNELAKVETSTRDGGVAEVKMTFPKHDPPIVTRSLVTYMMNSLLFGNSADRLRDNSRTFVLRIKDPSNPAEGKLKLSIEVNPPLMSFQTPSSVASSFEGTMLCRMLMSPNSGAGANPGSRIVVNMDRVAEMKATAAPPQCTISVSGPPTQLAKVRLHVPVTERDCGLTLKEGRNIMGPGGVIVGTFEQADQHNAVILFQPIPPTKSTAFTREKLQMLLRSVVVSNSEELDVKGSGAAALNRAPTTIVIPADMEGFGEVVAFDSTTTAVVPPPPPQAASSNGPLDASSPDSPSGTTTTGTATRFNPAPPPSDNGFSDRESVLGATSANANPSLPRARGSLRGAPSGIFGGANRRQSLFSGAASNNGLANGAASMANIDRDKLPAYQVPSADDDDDLYTLVVTWTFHDGANETIIKTRLCPKRQPVAATAAASSNNLNATNNTNANGGALAQSASSAAIIAPSATISLTSGRESAVE